MGFEQPAQVQATSLAWIESISAMFRSHPHLFYNSADKDISLAYKILRNFLSWGSSHSKPLRRLQSQKSPWNCQP